MISIMSARRKSPSRTITAQISGLIKIEITSKGTGIKNNSNARFVGNIFI